MADLASETERNARLKAALASLSAPMSEAASTMTAAQIKAASQLKVVDLQEKQFALTQEVEKAELSIKHLQTKLKEDQESLKNVGHSIDQERNSGKAVWETVGIQTVTYRDPFHTGLSKRTPTGGFFTS